MIECPVNDYFSWFIGYPCRCERKASYDNKYQDNTKHYTPRASRMESRISSRVRFLLTATRDSRLAPQRFPNSSYDSSIEIITGSERKKLFSLPVPRSDPQ